MSEQTPEHYIDITMFKVLIKLSSIEAHYPNGWNGFAKTYAIDSEPKPLSRLVALTSMSAGDVELFEVELTKNNLTLGEHFAVADQSGGALVPCTGIVIELFKTGSDVGGFPEWIAYASE